MSDTLIRLATHLVCLFPRVFAPPFCPPWGLYAFRRGSAGSHRYKTNRDVPYKETPTGLLGLDLYQPESDAPVPAVLLIHGGGWETGSKILHRGIGRLLASHGFLAAVVDYRPLRVAPWPACLDDCRDALAWLGTLAADHGADPARLALLGDSAGAHLASLLALEPVGTACKPKGVVAFYGPFDLTRPGRRCWPRRCQERLIGGRLTETIAWERARAISPVNRVTPGAPPFLLIHGQLDGIVSPQSSELMARALVGAGVEARVVRVEGADHGLFSLGRIWPCLAEIDREVVAFLKRVTA